MSTDRLWFADTLALAMCLFSTCWQMNYSDRTVSGVDMLASSSARPLGLNPQVLWVNCERYLTPTCKNRVKLHLNPSLTHEGFYFNIKMLCHHSNYLLYLCGLGQYSHSHGAGVHSSLFLCLGNPLYSMDSTFKFELLVAQRAADAG